MFVCDIWLSSHLIAGYGFHVGLTSTSGGSVSRGGLDGGIGLGTGFWFFHEILSFHVADFEYNPQNREY